MLFWAIAVPTWLIVATLGHMYFIPFSIRFNWDRELTKIVVALWPIGAPIAAVCIAFYGVMFSAIWIYKKTWGAIADKRVTQFQEERERQVSEWSRKKREKEDAEDLARIEALKEAQAKDQDEPQPIFRAPPKRIMCCSACESNEEHWRKAPALTMTEDERIYKSELEAKVEEEFVSSRHLAENTKTSAIWPFY